MAERIERWRVIAEQPPEGRYLVVRQCGDSRYVDVKAIPDDTVLGGQLMAEAIKGITHWMELPGLPE